MILRDNCTCYSSEEIFQFITGKTVDEFLEQCKSSSALELEFKKYILKYSEAGFKVPQRIQAAFDD